MHETLADTAALEEHLSRPTAAAVETLRRLDGDVVILGAGGKMGSTAACMVRRALDLAGGRARRVTAVSRFTDRAKAEALEAAGVATVSCDLLDRAAVAGLPDAGLVLHLTGQKFGTGGDPGRTWAVNTLAPAAAIERYAGARIVLFSTGCVYPLVPVAGPGAAEDAPLEPPGEYANAAVARERVSSFLAGRLATPLLLYRLCYSLEPRYGVIHDVARRVAAGEPVDLGMGWVHVIWQRDAVAIAIRCLEHAAVPAVPLNVTGIERVSVRRLAERCGECLGRTPTFVGREAAEAWLWDATRCRELFGPPETTTDEALRMVCEWIARGGESLGKPTHFEVRDGRY